MSSVTPDRADELARWTAHAPAWSHWADPMAELAQRLNQPLLHAAEITTGLRVLDLASGVGEPALNIARRVGPDGQVVGTDLVPAMLATAARRAHAAEMGNLGFTVADMAVLPFAAGAFDRATCRFGIMFCPQPLAVLREVWRVLRPGGRVALMVWGARGDNTLFDEVGGAVEAFLGVARNPRHDIAVLFRFAAPGALASLLHEAGFTAVAEHDVRPMGRVPVDRPFWQATLDMSFADRLSTLSPEFLAALKQNIIARFRARSEDGVVKLHLHARIVVGQRPLVAEMADGEDGEVPVVEAAAAGA